MRDCKAVRKFRFSVEAGEAEFPDNSIESGACFGCLNTRCGKRLYPKGEPVSPGGLLRAIPALLIPAAGFIAGYILPGLFVPGAGEALRAACGMTALFVSAGAWYIRGR